MCLFFDILGLGGTTCHVVYMVLIRGVVCFASISFSCCCCFIIWLGYFSFAFKLLTGDMGRNTGSKKVGEGIKVLGLGESFYSSLN